jgi:hypothetical protein
VFKTSSCAEFFPPASSRRESDLRFWSLVEQDMISPWFYLQLVEMRDDKAHRSMLLVQSTHHLENVVNAQMVNAWIEQVQVVVPAHLNKKKRWVMEPLLEVSCVFDKKSSQWGYIYIVEGGGTYFYPDHSARRDNPVGNLIFSAQKQIFT